MLSSNACSLRSDGDCLGASPKFVKALCDVGFTSVFARPPDDFPRTKSILWDKAGIGKATFLHLGYFRKPRVCISEKVLRLVQHQCENYGQKNHTLIGTLVVEDDGGGVQFQVDRLDTRPVISQDISANLAPGDLLIPLEVSNNTAGKRKGSVDEFIAALRRLQERCYSKSVIDLSSFVLLRGWMSFYSNAHSSVAHMDFDMVTMGMVFKATPISSVPIVLTALSKNLAGPNSLSHTQGMPKSGYLTMDHARKLLLVLESDPKAGTLPIVGIWVSGLNFIQHSFVWAACLRYIHNTYLQDRVCAPPEDFLLVLYSPLHSRPEFFQCTTATGESKLSYELWCGHEVSNLTKSLSSQSDDFTEVELDTEQNKEEKALFDAALAKYSTILSEGHPEKRWTEDINPRSIPTPHTEFLPVIKPMVPDVSILWSDSPDNSALPSSINSIPQPTSLGMYTANVNNNRTPINQSSFTQQRSFSGTRSQSDNPQMNLSTPREPLQHLSQPHVSLLQNHQRFQHSSPSFQNNSPFSNVSNNSLRTVENHSVSSTSYNDSIPVHHKPHNQNIPIFHTQSQALFHNISSHPISTFNTYSHPPVHFEAGKISPNVMPTLQHLKNNTFYSQPQSQMVLSSSQRNDDYSMNQHMINDQLLVSKQQELNPYFPGPMQVPYRHQTQYFNSNPQSLSKPVSRNSLVSNNYQEPQNTILQQICPPDAVPISQVRNQFETGNTLRTVVEESSSSSSCSRCNCHAEKNSSTNSGPNTSRPGGADACVNASSHNSTKSNDDDSGLSVTPERPNSSPTPKAANASETSIQNTSHDNECNSTLGAAINNVNWDQVPPEIQALLLQQNEQLKILQQQIQMLMSNQSQKMSTTNSDSASSNPPQPPASSQNMTARELCSVAVNTSFPGDQYVDPRTQRHQFVPQPLQTSNSNPTLTDVSRSQNRKRTEDICNSYEMRPDLHIQMHSTSYDVSNETNNPAPQTQPQTDDQEGDSTSGSSDLCSKDSRNSMNAVEVSEFDPNRSQNDPNDSDFYNNCQDESYSTVAEEAADPRQFYDQIMSNINMFLTNGEDSNVMPDKEDETSLSLQDSTTKFSDSANSTMFPHINYISMMLGASSETGQSMEMNAMAMKYLKDDQLTQMALMLQQNGGSDRKTTNKLLQRMITADSNTKSMSEISHLGISPNNLTMGTRNYLEKHGLMGHDSQCYNDYSVLDHTLKLKTDFSVAMTDKDSDKSNLNISPAGSPFKNCRRSDFAQLRRKEGASPSPANFNGKSILNDNGASPQLMAPKHYNVAHSPTDRHLPKNRHNRIFEDYTDDDNADSENILDIAKLKQLPKLL